MPLVLSNFQSVFINLKRSAILYHASLSKAGDKGMASLLLPVLSFVIFPLYFESNFKSIVSAFPSKNNLSYFGGRS